jgi:NAD(P)H-hydrate epimerase
MPRATDLSWAGTSKHLAETPRSVDGNKGKFGHVLLLGGSLGKAGAPSMASLAAMRTGAGLTTAAILASILPTVARVAPELMCTPLAEHNGGLSLDQLAEKPLSVLLKGITVVALGPGVGQEGSTPEFVRAFVERVSLPMVIDADGLNALAGRADLLKRLASTADAHGKTRTIVLTPHPGEMARLVESSVKAIEADRVNIARRFATANGVTLVLKGWRTLIAHPDGHVAVNTTGNPSMAKGGSGDILTGIVAAMLAQYPHNVAEAVEAAVFLHGLAGDFAALAQDEHTVLATDTVAHLWRAFRARTTGADGLTWIAGLAARASEAVHA